MIIKRKQKEFAKIVLPRNKKQFLAVARNTRRNTATKIGRTLDWIKYTTPGEKAATLGNIFTKKPIFTAAAGAGYTVALPGTTAAAGALEAGVTKLIPEYAEATKWANTQYNSGNIKSILSGVGNGVVSARDYVYQSLTPKNNLARKAINQNIKTRGRAKVERGAGRVARVIKYNGTPRQTLQGITDGVVASFAP